MSPVELEQYLHEHIPLSKAMETSVASIGEDTLSLSAPLAPNIKHRETVFGGSASTLAILAAWSLLQTRLRRAGIDCRLVIQRNTMEYEKPILGEFSARASLAQPQSWERFTRMLASRGKARTTVTSLLEHAGEQVGSFSGEFVALANT